jgi:hypothetical protein
MGRFGGKIFWNTVDGLKYNGGAIGYEAVFDKVLFNTIFSRYSMVLPGKFLMGPTSWIFSITGRSMSYS